MQLSGSSRWLLRVGTAITLAFLYIPLIVIVIYAFNSTRVQKWPPAVLNFSWFDRDLHNLGVRDALLSVLDRPIRDPGSLRLGSSNALAGVLLCFGDLAQNHRRPA